MTIVRRGIFGVLGLIVVAHWLNTVAGLGSPGADELLQVYLYLGVLGCAAVLCAWRAAVVSTDRLAWLLLGGYLALSFCSSLLWAVWLAKLESPPFPNLADAFSLPSYACAYVALVLLLRTRLHRFSPSQWFDGLVAGLTLAAVCAAVIFGPILAATEGSAVTIAFTLAYPVADLLLLCLVGIAFGMTGWRPGRAWGFLGVGLAVFAIADAMWAYLVASGSFGLGAIPGSLWITSFVALGAAAWQPSPRGTVRRDGLEIVAAPALFAVVALGILVAAPLVDVPFPGVALAAAALVAVGGRAGLTFAENLRLLRASRHEALTDALSGLGNRRRLMDELDDAVAAANRRDPQTLLFFDLDGFKAYNDVFGHHAGDVLLARLGRALADAVDGRGTAYRLGGDEFCALLHERLDHGDAVVEQALAALSEEGEGFSITASYGLVSIPGDAETSTEALQLADERMFADKGSRRASAVRQTRDLLMQVLKEREPELRLRMEKLAELAVAVGRRLDMSGEELDELARATELHDIGKIAVPDSVLDKQGPLDALERELTMKHTLVGERILSAAPALRPVARLVRASHERFDGGGYPDALSGDEIPLGARVIAVCDAYEAMLTEKPYRSHLEPDAARAELRRGAGTQFDPDVVAAFAAVCRDGSSRPLVGDLARGAERGD